MLRLGINAVESLPQYYGKFRVSPAVRPTAICIVFISS